MRGAVANVQDAVQIVRNLLERLHIRHRVPSHIHSRIPVGRFSLHWCACNSGLDEKPALVRPDSMSYFYHQKVDFYHESEHQK